MKATRFNRTIVFSEIDAKVNDIKNLPTEVEITLNYTSKGADALSKAIVLDNVIIPEIIELFNAHRRANAAKAMLERQVKELTALAVKFKFTPTECMGFLGIDPDRTCNGGVEEVMRITLEDGDDFDWVSEVLEKEHNFRQEVSRKDK